MRGEWKCRDWELDHWSRKLEADIAFVYRYRDSRNAILDYTRDDITPGQIGQVLGCLGWESADTDIEDGYYYDYYYHVDYKGYQLVIETNIITFGLRLYFINEPMPSSI